MLSVSDLRTWRGMRMLIALLISATALYTICTAWSPLYQSPHEENTPPLESSETTAAAEKTTPSLNPPDAPSEPAPPSNESTHSLNYDTAIPSIPDKIWHTAKDTNLPDHQRQWIRTWTQKNPYHRQELLTDQSSESFVRAHFHASRPDIVEVYEGLAVPILRADLLRYLVLLAEGGIWSDLDVTCEKEVKGWISPELKAAYHEFDVIVGLEFDFAWRGPGRQVASQFCNWAFAAKPGSRSLQVVVDSVVEKVKGIASANGVPISGITLDMFKDVVDVTGPKIMTLSILKGLQGVLGRKVDDRDFSGIKAPKMLGDVLVLPGTSFAAYQNGFPVDQADDLVTHHYESSWKQADEEAKERKKVKLEGSQ